MRGAFILLFVLRIKRGGPLPPAALGGAAASGGGGLAHSLWPSSTLGKPRGKGTDAPPLAKPTSTEEVAFITPLRLQKSHSRPARRYG